MVNELLKLIQKFIKRAILDLLGNPEIGWAPTPPWLTVCTWTWSYCWTPFTVHSRRFLYAEWKRNLKFEDTRIYKNLGKMRSNKLRSYPGFHAVFNELNFGSCMKYNTTLITSMITSMKSSVRVQQWIIRFSFRLTNVYLLPKLVDKLYLDNGITIWRWGALPNHSIQQKVKDSNGFGFVCFCTTTRFPNCVSSKFMSIFLLNI